MSLPDRIEGKIDRSGECHLWTAALHRSGYGVARFAGKFWYAHRLVWTFEVGPIPPGLTLDHVATQGCTSRACVNTKHLELVTLAENNRRGNSPAAINARKTHCVHGHLFDAANTYVTADTGKGARPGTRTCRRCRADREAKRRAGRRLGGPQTGA